VAAIFKMIEAMVGAGDESKVISPSKLRAIG